MKVGIINVTGYAGSELARLLWHHPEVELVSVSYTHLTLPTKA